MEETMKSDKEKALERKRLRAWVQKILPDDHDKVDVDAEYDSTLTYDENKTHFRDLLKDLIKDIKTKYAEANSEQERFNKEKLEAAEKEVEQYNNSLVFDDNKDLKVYYAPITRGVNKICQGYSNLLFIKGRGGIGKSYQIRKSLIQNKADFTEVCGEVTEAYLYRLLYENNGKVIWLKDVVKLLQAQGSLNLLKSACETEEKRVLTKNNYSKEQEDLPDKFVCRCKFIFDYNNLFGMQLKDDFEALVTRGDYKELPFSDDDMKKLLRMIARTDEEKEVTEAIIKEFKTNGVVKLNLRTQWKAFKTYHYCKKNNLDWKKELKQELQNVSRNRSMLYTLIGNKAVRTTELKQLLLKNEYVSTIRTADRKIQEWLYLEELYKVSGEDRNFYICINNIKK